MSIKIKKNLNASIHEVVLLYALNKMFPQFTWTNEYLLKNIATQSGINVSKMRYDIFCPEKNIAFEMSRAQAHASDGSQDRDLRKAYFSNHSGVILFSCRNQTLNNEELAKISNLKEFREKKQNKDVYDAIYEIKFFIEDTICDLERMLGEKRKVKTVKFDKSLPEIRELYHQITNGYLLDGEDAKEFTNEQLCKRLSEISKTHITKTMIQNFMKTTQYPATLPKTISEGYIYLQKNASKIVVQDRKIFLAKNKEAVQALNEYFSSKK